MRSMATDGPLGKTSRMQLPAFLNRISPPSVWRAFLRGEPPTRGGARWSLKFMLLAWLFIGIAGGKALRDRFDDARRSLAALFTARRRSGRTYPGLQQRAQGMSPTLAQRFIACLRPRLQRGLQPLWNSDGWIVFTADGSRFDVPRTRANRRALGRAGREGSGPQMWLTLLVHLPSRVIWDFRQAEATASERGHLREMLPSLPPGTLAVLDAGFVGFDVMSDMRRRGFHFLIRCGANMTLLIDQAEPLRLDRESSADVLLWPGNRRGREPLKLRLITLRRGGKRMHLLTSVLDPTQLSRAQARRLYEQRWGVELQFRALKQTLERRKLLARTPQAAAWELAGSVLALALLLAMAAWSQGARACRAAVAQLLRTLREALRLLQMGRSTRGVVCQIGSAKLDDYQRRRPKRRHRWPDKKHDTPPGMPKLRPMRSNEIAARSALKRQPGGMYA